MPHCGISPLHGSSYFSCGCQCTPMRFKGEADTPTCFLSWILSQLASDLVFFVLRGVQFKIFDILFFWSHNHVRSIRIGNQDMLLVNMFSWWYWPARPFPPSVFSNILGEWLCCVAFLGVTLNPPTTFLGLFYRPGIDVLVKDLYVASLVLPVSFDFGFFRISSFWMRYRYLRFLHGSIAD